MAAGQVLRLEGQDRLCRSESYQINQIRFFLAIRLGAKSLGMAVALSGDYSMMALLSVP